MGAYVEKLKTLKTEVEAEVPNPPSGKTGDVIGEYFAISKPENQTVNNPTKGILQKENAMKGEKVKEKMHFKLKRNK